MERRKGSIGAQVSMYVFFILVLVGPGDVRADWLDSLKMAQRAANDDRAEERIRLLVTASEAFKAAHKRYPESEDELLNPEGSPGYINQRYDGQQMGGYEYSLTFQEEEVGDEEAQGKEAGYRFIARPVRCQETGTKVFIAESGKEMTQEDCE